MKGYDEYSTLLLPPRPPGDKLPKELLDYYDEQLKKLEEAENARRLAEKAEIARQEENRDGERIDMIHRQKYSYGFVVLV